MNQEVEKKQTEVKQEPVPKTTDKIKMGGSTDTKKSTRKIFLSSPMQKSYTMLGITLLAIILIIGAVITPTFSTIANRRAEIAVLEDDLTFLTDRFNTISSLNSEYTGNANEVGLSERIKIIDKYHPTNKNTITLINALQKVSQKTGVQIVSISSTVSNPNKEETNPFVSEGNVSLMIRAYSINSLLSFVSEFEKTPYYPSFTSISIEEEGSEGVYETTVSFKLLFINENFKLTDEE